MTETEQSKKNPLGPTGEVVRANVKHLREAHGLTYKELSERLAKIERPIPTLGLSRIEAGNRRVDADDLVALAVVFNVSPLTLLLPRQTIDEWAYTRLTDGTFVLVDDAWRWALNERALPAEPGERPDQDVQEQYERLSQWQGLRYAKRLPVGRAADVLLEEVRELAKISEVSTERVDEEFEQRLKAVRTGIDRLAAEVDHAAAVHAELSQDARQFKAEYLRQQAEGAD